jgi:hypothetical protein
MGFADGHIVIFRGDTREYLCALEFFSDRIEWSRDVQEALLIDRGDVAETIGHEALRRLGDPYNKSTRLQSGKLFCERGVFLVESLMPVSNAFRLP